MGAGHSFRNTTASTRDVHSSMEYGTRLHAAAALRMRCQQQAGVTGEAMDWELGEEQEQNEP